MASRTSRKEMRALLTLEIDELVHASAFLRNRALLACRSEMSGRLPEPRHLEEWLVSA